MVVPIRLASRTRRGEFTGGAAAASVDIGKAGNGGSPDSATGRRPHGTMVSADTDPNGILPEAGYAALPVPVDGNHRFAFLLALWFAQGLKTFGCIHVGAEPPSIRRSFALVAGRGHRPDAGRNYLILNKWETPQIADGSGFVSRIKHPAW